MNKFNVGDLIKGVKKSPYHITNENMLLGRVIGVTSGGIITAKVLKHTEERYVGSVYPMLNPTYFEFAFSDLETEIRIYRDGNKVIAQNTSTGEKGIARCCPEDEFYFEYGAKLAFERLMTPKVGDKVRIVADNVHHYHDTGSIVTIKTVNRTCLGNSYSIKESNRIITDKDFVKCTEEDVWYNGKVVCIETPFSDKLTVGKIYTFDDGYLTFNDGEKTMTRYRSFEDLTKRFKAKFIEVVE